MGKRTLVLFLAVAACGTSNSAAPGFGPTTGAAGGAGGRAPPAGSTSGSTGGGANGNDSLSGALAFTPQNAWATAATSPPTPLEAALTDSSQTCSDEGSYQSVHVLLSLSDGGAPVVGTYAIGQGASVELWRGPPSGLALFAQAVSGQVTLNQLDDSNAGGNFAVSLQPVDGGAPSDLSGLFVAPRCY